MLWRADGCELVTVSWGCEAVPGCGDVDVSVIQRIMPGIQNAQQNQHSPTDQLHREAGLGESHPNRMMAEPTTRIVW